MKAEIIEIHLKVGEKACCPQPGDTKIKHPRVYFEADDNVECEYCGTKYRFTKESHHD